MNRSIAYSVSLISTLFLLGAGCKDAKIGQIQENTAAVPVENVQVKKKAYRPSNINAAARGDVFIEREYSQGMHPCADVIHVFRGYDEQFSASLADCLPEKDESDPTGQRYIYDYNFVSEKDSLSVQVLAGKEDPEFTISAATDANSIWLKVRGKTVIYDMPRQTFSRIIKQI